MRVLQHFRNVALDDALGEALGDRRLADAGIADIERVVLRAAAEHLDGAVDLGLAADQRIDLAGPRLLVEVDAVGGQRVLLLLLAVLALPRRCPAVALVFLGAARRARFRWRPDAWRCRAQM